MIPIVVSAHGANPWLSGRIIRPRWLAKIMAERMGYFWAPCPVCTKMFAGFECGRYGMYTGPQAGKIACVREKCQQTAEQSYNDFRTAMGWS